MAKKKVENVYIVTNQKNIAIALGIAVATVFAILARKHPWVMVAAVLVWLGGKFAIEMYDKPDELKLKYVHKVD